MTGNIRFELEGHVAHLVLDRPEKLNAMTRDMTVKLAAAVERCNGDDNIRCVILTGAGEKAFCAGSDIAELDSFENAWQFRNRSDYCDAIRRLRKPALCAINGYALGGGLELALACDVRIASSNAQFAAPEIKLGWIGGGGMTVQLVHAIGPSNAALMIMTGEPIGAERALAWGLVSEVVPPSGLREGARAIAANIAARAPIAAETAKVNLRAALSMSAEAATAYERGLQAICFATEDAREGRVAFKEKRRPDFRHR